MAQNDIGIDLGTTTIIIAQEGKGVVLNQPSVVAMDTRKNTVLEAGDKALAMVGRTPNYISAIFPLKDGVISDHTMTRELICRFVKQVYSSHMVKPRVAVCVPAAITGIESDAVVEAVVAAGARQVYLIDEPIAAALGSGIDITLPDGRIDEVRAEALLNTARDAGVNYFDTAYPYHGGESEPFVGRVIAKWPRESFYLATKLPLWLCDSLEKAQQIYRSQFERLGVDTIDFYLLHLSLIHI